MDSTVTTPSYQDLLEWLKYLVEFIETGSDGWSFRDYQQHEQNVLSDVNEIIAKAKSK